MGKNGNNKNYLAIMVAAELVSYVVLFMVLSYFRKRGTLYGVFWSLEPGIFGLNRYYWF